MRLVRSKRVWLFAVAGVLALFLIRPGAGGLKFRVAKSISAAIGRPVEIGNLHIRLLPQPGFDLENFVVHDDPAFSAEPFLRAQEVTAALRLTSLLRGRLDVSRLSLTEPSVNLVQNSQAQWNIEELLQRTSQIAVAPTAKGRSERRPGFPYIEADRGRINFKVGAEKKPWALTDADFALWQESENAWSMRLKSQPVRTDFNLSDTGTLKIEGTWQRAANLAETPLNFTAQWYQAQLGQLSKLFSGQDRGWRGGISTSLTFSGKPADLGVSASFAIQDFHRYDIIAPDTLHLSANCLARYRAQQGSLQDIICGAPVGDGTIRLQGNLSGILARHEYDLTFSAEDLPVQALVNVARHSKKDLAQDMLADGTLNAQFSVKKNVVGDDALQLSGTGQTNHFQLRSASTNAALELGTIPFSFADRPSVSSAAKRVKPAPRMPADSRVRLAVGPFSLPMGRPEPATVHGWLDASGYDFEVSGDSQIKHVLQIARTLGLPAWPTNVNGIANLDLQIAGQWNGFAAPTITGKARLSAAHAVVRGLNTPLDVTAANLIIDSNQTQVDKLAFATGDAHWTGSLFVPRHCASIETCPIRFDLHTETISCDTLNALFNPNPPKRPWYRMLSPAPAGKPVLNRLDASGRFTASRLAIKSLVFTHVSSAVQFDQGKLRFSELRGEIMGGKHQGEWGVDFTSKPPVYSGTGTLTSVSLTQLATAMKDGWITGIANARYQLSVAGYSLSDMLGSAHGEAVFEMRDGTLPHIVLTSGSGSLHVHRFVGRLSVQDGSFELKEGKLLDASGIYQVSGTATMGSQLNMRIIADPAHSFNVGGTLLAPRITPASSSETQAALKQ